jgi:hypothetical protein
MSGHRPNLGSALMRSESEIKEDCLNAVRDGLDGAMQRHDYVHPG